MSIEEITLLVIIGCPLLAAAVLFAIPRRIIGRAAGWLAGGAAALAVIATFALIPALQRGEVPTIVITWVPTAHIDLSLHIDWLTLPFLITEGVVTLLSIVYAWGSQPVDSRTPYFYGLLLVFAVGMSGTTLADDMFLFYTFWELMLVASFALILLWGHATPDGRPLRTVALKYFIFTHLGSLLVLTALVILYDTTGTDRFSDLRAGLSMAPAMVTTVTAFFLIGFCIKMAIFPLHLWLPDAHTVAPMPVTIMLAAAMLSMGTYGILRFPMSLFSRAQMATFAVPMMVGGVISEIYGALMAMAERDIKRIVAYSSVSQMGYILFGLGTLTYDGIVGATLHVVFHAIVKALLFMGIGLVVRATGRRRITELGGLRSAMPVAAVCTGIGALAIAGTPPFCIFDSEWMIFAGGFHTPHLGLSILAVFGSLLTVAYALWFVGRIFFGARPEGLEVKRLPWAMVAPTVLLTILALVEGLFPAPVFDWADRAMALILGGHW